MELKFQAPGRYQLDGGSISGVGFESAGKVAHSIQVLLQES